MKKVNGIKKPNSIFVTFAVAVLLILLISVTFVALLNSDIIVDAQTSNVPSNMLQYEWSQNTASAQRTNFADGPSPSQPNIQWIAKIPNLLQGPWAFNGLVIVQTWGFIYSGIRIGTQTIALDRSTGKIVWNITASGNIAKLDNTYMLIGSNCYKIADGSLVWTGPSGFSNGGGWMQGISYIPELKAAASGGILWNLQNPAQLPTAIWNRANMTDYGIYSSESPQVYGNGVIVYSTTFNFLRGVNATTGQTIWTTPTTTGFSYGMSYIDGKIVHGGYDGNMRAWNITTGELLWTFNPGTYYNQWAIGTAVAYGMVYEHNQDTYTYAVNATTGELVWKSKGPGIGYSNYLTVAGGKVFIQSGENQYRDFATGEFGYSKFDALDAFTGEIVWSAPFENGAPNNMQCNAYGNLYVIPTTSSASNDSYTYSGGTAGTGYQEEVWCIGDTPRDWPMFLNDPEHSANGFGPTNLMLKWKFTAGAAFASSPTFVNGVGYIGSKDGIIYAFDASTGQQIWNYTAGLMIYSTMAVANGKLYTGADDGSIHCLDAKTGTKVWTTTLSGIKPTAAVLAAGIEAVVSSPIIYNGKVYLGALDGVIYCLDANSGTIIWQVQTGGPIYATPTIVDDSLYITSSTPTAGSFFKLNPATGNIILNTTLPYPDTTVSYGMGRSMVASPTIGNGVAFVRTALLYNYALNTITGEILWTYNATINPGTAQQNGGCGQVNALYKNGLFIFNDYYGITALNALDGSLAWQSYTSRENVAQGISCSFNNIYVVNEAGIMHVLDAQTGKSLSYYSFNTQMHSIPTPYNGSLYVGTNDWNLYCFSEAPPATIVSTSITFELRPSSIVFGDTTTVAGSINNVHSAVPMNVYFSKHDSSLPVNISAVTDENGGFTVMYKPDITGDWTVFASWPGDATHLASSSQSQTLTVTEPQQTMPLLKADVEAALSGLMPLIIGIIVAVIVTICISIYTIVAVRKLRK
ncbi:MAG: PQQ-binding-like beta-propeller repeat protein [Candidatus Bathyarchaeota archaeon]|nr:PQQ-binding-like beta-propeller repeat protein [Candidatus Bathyarchaeota archaeon]